MTNAVLNRPEAAHLRVAPAALDVRPLTGHIGAEIHGLDLTRALSPDTVAAIQAALWQWKVVFLRDQPLTHAQHVALASQFGQPTLGHPVYGYVEGHPQVYSVARNRFTDRHAGEQLIRPWTGWHTDVTAAVNPPAASILRGVVIPPYGGDTQWTNLEKAYEGLSPTLRAFVDTLRGIHQFVPPEGQQATDEFLRRNRARPLISEHPLVRLHPVTGRRSLYVSPLFLQSIIGLSPRESRALLDLLFEHIVRPEYTVRFRWEEGSIAFWDNNATAHLAPRDIYDLDFDRQLYRVTLKGDVPVGVDGRPSRALEGEPLEAYE